MIGASFPNYVFIRLCITILHWIAPLSVLYCLTSLIYPAPFPVSRMLQVWTTLETAFYVFVYHPRRHYLQRAAIHPPPVCHEHRRILFQRCHESIPDPEHYLRKWFMDAPASEIKWENVKEFFRWAFLDTGVPNAGDDEELDEYVGEMEKLLGRRIGPGRGNAKCLRLTLEKVGMLHRSLIWYLVSRCNKESFNPSFHSVIHVTNLASIVCLCRGHSSVWLHVVLLLQLPQHFCSAIPCSLPVPPLRPCHPPSVARENLNLLAPSTYRQGKTPDSICSWYWYWTLSLHKLPCRTELRRRDGQIKWRAGYNCCGDYVREL